MKVLLEDMLPPPETSYSTIKYMLPRVQTFVHALRAILLQSGVDTQVFVYTQAYVVVLILYVMVLTFSIYIVSKYVVY